MPRPVLLLLSQLPHDPTSGAAHSMLEKARILAKAGCRVRALATAATEGRAEPLLALLARLGIKPEVDRRAAVGRGLPVVRFEQGGVHFSILDTGSIPIRDWDFPHGRQFSRLLVNELERFTPKVVYTFGGTSPEQARRQLCRAAGATVVFCLKNLSYMHPLAFEAVDAVVTPSAFLSEHYRVAIGLESTPIPPPMDPAEIICPQRDPRCFTFVNPTPNKGVYFFVTLADELGRRRPEIPLQVIESRGTGQHLLDAGLHGGIDLRRHPNLRIDSNRPRPRDVFAQARAILVPSLWLEPFGRIAGEAMLNGVPALVSGRGGLAEAVGDGGFVLPIPDSVTPESMRPAPASAVEAWVKTIERLHDDSAFYAEACARAQGAGARLAPERIASQYVEFFERVTPASRPVVGVR